MAIACSIHCGNTKVKTMVKIKLVFKISKLSHPDLHFAYPTVSTESVKQSLSIDFIAELRFLTCKTLMEV
jgi:DNA polymerase-3 subunit delta'